MTALPLVLGARLHDLRAEKGQSLLDLERAALLPGANEFAYKSYEQGTRRLSLERMTDICRTLGEHPGIVLNTVCHQLLDHSPAIDIDVARLAQTTTGPILALRAWATRQSERPSSPTVISVPIGALPWLAVACGTNAATIEEALRALPLPAAHREHV